MISKVFCIVTSLMSLFALVSCEPPVIPPSTQYGAPISSYGTPNYNADQHHHHHNEDHGEPKSYEFGYQVKDEYTGNNYKRQEASDGNQVQGEYRVQLPDGRTQIVTYYADWQTGFHADVRYEGEAQYPENFGNNGGFGGGHGVGPGLNAGFGNLAPQYGPPGYAGGHNGGYNLNNLNNFNNPATSVVSIKDYSGPGTPYNVGGGGGYGNGYQGNGYQHQAPAVGGYDSYANAGNFGSKVRPSSVYGAL